MAETSPLIELVEVIGRLHRECAWKAAQTHQSLVRFLLEETHELVEAIESGSTGDLREELGDVLLQVYLHAAIAARSGDFTVEDVAADLIAKLIRRNPHVYGDLDLDDPAEINEAWQAVKAEEKRRTHLMEGVPESLTTLLFADKYVDRARRDGHDLVLDESSDDVGEQLLALVARAQADGVDPDQALRSAVRRRVSSPETP